MNTSRRKFLGLCGGLGVSALVPSARRLEVSDSRTGVAAGAGDLVGGTPMIKIGKLAPPPPARVVAKLEMLNPMSVKDRPAKYMIAALQKSRKLQPDTEIVEASSGNTAIGVAQLSSQFGFKTKFFMSEAVSLERRIILKAYGAKIVLTPALEHTRGARERAMDYCRKTPRAVYLNQHDNEANPLAHYETTGPEIWRTLGQDIAAVVVGLGSCGCFSGISRYLKEKNPTIKIIGFEPKSSPVYSGGPQGEHHITGIGPGFIAPNFLRARGRLDDLILVTDEDAFEWTRRIVLAEGLLVGLTSGAAAKVAYDVARRPEFKGGTIVCLFCDTGERYLSVKGLFPES
jgi:cysteine synthase